MATRMLLVDIPVLLDRHAPLVYGEEARERLLSAQP